MCKREICLYLGCLHKVSHREDFFEMCEPAQLTGVYCHPVTTEEWVDQTMPWCEHCQLKLMQRLEEIQRLQETGWQWSLNVYNWEARRRTSVEKKWKVNGHASVTTHNGEGPEGIQDGEELERLQIRDSPEQIRDGEELERIQIRNSPEQMPRWMFNEG